MIMLKKILPKTGLDETVKRFALSIAFCFLAFVTYLYAGGADKAFDAERLSYSVIFYSVLSYFWCGAAVIFSEARGYSVRKGYLVSLIGCAVILPLVAFPDVMASNILWLFAALLLLIMVAPFLNHRADDDALFWQYNCTLWTGIAGAVFATAVLYIGCVAGLASVEYLFGLKWAFKYYSDIFFLCAMVIAPIYALFWVPRSFGEGVQHVPLHCRILVNWILVPLMTAYLLILYAYLTKIGVTVTMPKGQLSAMIAGLGVLGIVIYMMAWPMVRDGTWLLKFLNRHFFKLMLVPIVMMTIALSMRVGQYGVTEQRYLVLLVLLWFGILCGFVLFKKDVPLKVIVFVLMSLMTVAAVGPLGSVSVSAHSQVQRLESILARNGILTDADTIVPAKQSVSFADEREISSILDYLSVRRFKGYLPEGVEKLLQNSDGRRSSIRREVKLVMQDMGLEYKGAYDKAPDPEKGSPFSISLMNADNTAEALSTQGYRYVLKSFFSINAETKKKEPLVQAERTYTYKRQGLYHKYNAVIKDRELVLTVEGYPALVFDLAAYVQPLIADGLKPTVPSMLVEASNSALKAELKLNHLSGFVRDGRISIQGLNGSLVLYFR